MGIKNAFYRSRAGLLKITSSGAALLGVRFSPPGAAARVSAPRGRLLRDCVRQLDEYFEGKRKAFRLPLRFCGTGFQVRVWRTLRQVPYGKKVPYSALASRADFPKAVRAVASAVARNPFAVLVPCHRIVAKNGGLAGYAWGVRKKKWLLKHEERPRRS